MAFLLDDLDTDGALREAGERRDLPGGLPRRAARRRGAFAVGPHRAGQSRRGRRDPELRARARVPAVVVLHGGRALQGVARDASGRAAGGLGRARARAGVQGCSGGRRSSRRRSTSAARPRTRTRSSRRPWPSRTSRWPPTRARRPPDAPLCSRRRCRSTPSRRATRPGCATSSVPTLRSTPSTSRSPRSRRSSWSSPTHFIITAPQTMHGGPRFTG